MSAEIGYHFIEVRDLAGVVDLAGALRVTFAGVESRWLCRALCEDALRGRVFCLVGEVDGQVAGFVIALVNAAAYWKELAIRRPILGLRILAGRFRREKLRAGPAGSAEPADSIVFEAGPTPENWAESGDTIAKIQFIGVGPAFRGRGIGLELYQRLAAHLSQRGLARIDARIAVDNIASIKLHRAAGWKLYRDADGILATYPLRETSRTAS